MANIERSYNNIKQIAVEKYKSYFVDERNEILKKLKERNENHINSERALDSISNLEMLVQVLENRDILNSTNIGVMVNIFTVLKLDGKHLKAHNRLLNLGRNSTGTLPMPPTAYEIKEIGGQTPVKISNDSKSHITDSSKFVTLNHHKNRAKLPEEAVNVIASLIGLKWKTFARYLKVVPEPVIDAVERNSSFSVEMRARLVLAEYQKNINPLEINSRLLKALRASKRTDIHDQIINYF